MDDSRTGTDTSGDILERARTAIVAADRGWKATMLGVGIVLVFAVGLL